MISAPLLPHVPSSWASTAPIEAVGVFAVWVLGLPFGVELNGPGFNIAPTQALLTVMGVPRRREAERMPWGFRLQRMKELGRPAPLSSCRRSQPGGTGAGHSYCRPRS
jgi:hypothetical protein